jgi:hypothetical protein
MMNKKINHLDLFTVKIGELSEMLEPFELEFFYHKKVTAQNRYTFREYVRLLC